MHAPNYLIRESRSASIDSPVFSIFIPSWNNLPYLKLCIDSLRKHSLLRHQIIVHINEGKDGSLEWVKSQSELSYTYSTQNVGVCYALNQCRTLALGDYLLYLNDDMYVCPGWDQHLFAEIKNIGHDYFFISATAIEPVASGNACVIVKDFGSDASSFQEEALLTEFEGLEKKDWQGATWPPNVVHKRVWDLIGGYSTEFSPGMYSDPDFSIKLWKAGVRLFKGINKSRVYHFSRKSTTRIVHTRGYFTFISKWGMSAKTFTQRFLRSGAPFDGELTEPEPSFLGNLKNRFKRVQAAFKS